MNAADLVNMLVSDVLRANPVTAAVFIDRRMPCVGCTFAPFETVAEVARVYGIEPAELANSLAGACVQARGSKGSHQ
jgi:hybrid cluster-associated redox disulfide protein